jgi:hypothetical protein
MPLGVRALEFIVLQSKVGEVAAEECGSSIRRFTV